MGPDRRERKRRSDRQLCISAGLRPPMPPLMQNYRRDGGLELPPRRRLGITAPQGRKKQTPPRRGVRIKEPEKGRDTPNRGRCSESRFFGSRDRGSRGGEESDGRECADRARVPDVALRMLSVPAGALTRNIPGNCCHSRVNLVILGN